MAISFKELKHGTSASFQKLQQEVDKMKKFNKTADDRFWQPTVDKEGNGSAVIRFMPAGEGEEVPFVRMFTHGFKGPTGKWYIENSRTTIGESGPVSDLNSKLWNSTDNDDSVARKMARLQKRRLSYISNIYVIKDSGNPENEGKVFLYRYGVKIWEKVNAALHPKFEDDVAVNPFDMWKGANFRLRICKVAGYRNYDESVFSPVSALNDDESVMEKAWSKCYPLLPIVAADKFKSYDSLQKKLFEVIGNSADFVMKGGDLRSTDSVHDDDEVDGQDDELRSVEKAHKVEPTPEVESEREPDLASESVLDQSDDDDVKKYFQSMK